MKAQEGNEIMTPYQLADRLGICLPTVYKGLNDGTLPCIKIGRKYLISRKKIDQMLGVK